MRGKYQTPFLITLNQERVGSSLYLLGFKPHPDGQDLRKLWAAAKWSQWSCLYPPLAHRKFCRGCGLLSEPQPGPLTWIRRTIETVPEQSAFKTWGYFHTSTQLLRPEGLHISFFWLQFLSPFLSSFDEMIKGEYLGDSSERYLLLFINF